LRESWPASIAIDKTLAEAIARVRATGVSWAEVGHLLGATDEAQTRQDLIDALAANRRSVLEHLLRETS
jgi:hypothetical protein